MDLIRELHFDLSTVLAMGYFTAHALWMVLEEVRARDLEHLAFTLDCANGTTEFRAKYMEWVNERQPRKNASSVIPKEVMKRMREVFRG
jgi:hypothetical protein